MAWSSKRRGRRPCRSLAAGGFTLLEVMIALVLAAVGLLGTLAVQQTMFRATGNAGDAAVATRLAMRVMEEHDAKVVSAGPPVVDQLAAAATTGWSAAVYLDASGVAGSSASADRRWKREVQVTNLGVGQPYNVSVQISYALDTGAPRVVRLDSQRWKTW
jgi:prepilin-type N-terminal cleavage/methylation domain-containing protein